MTTNGFFGAGFLGPLTAIKRGGVGLEDLLAVLIHVVELPALQRPGEDAEDRQHEHGGEGDEEVEDVHGARRQRASRSELTTTASELAAMPSPAAQGGSRPASASGTQTAL